jgi:hypothetical protein
MQYQMVWELWELPVPLGKYGNDRPEPQTVVIRRREIYGHSPRG